jgi:hypothetical protein
MLLISEVHSLIVMLMHADAGVKKSCIRIANRPANCQTATYHSKAGAN